MIYQTRSLTALLLTGAMAGCSFDYIRDANEFGCNNSSAIRLVNEARVRGAGGTFDHFFMQYKDSTLPWTKVDEAGKRSPIYTNIVYSDDDQFTPYATYFRYPFLNYALRERERERPGLPGGKFLSDYRQYGEWDVFVDPERFSRDQFASIRQCITSNLQQMNKALAPESPEAYLGKSEFRLPPQITSIVYRKHDYHSTYCERHTLTKEFTCPGDGTTSIYLSPPNRVEMRGKVTLRDGRTIQSCRTIGLITDDQEQIYIRDPDSLFLPTTGSDWAGYYGRCRASDGKNIYDHFAPKMLIAPKPSVKPKP